MTLELTKPENDADWGPQRSKTVTWHSPGPSTAKGLTMSGVDYLRAMVDGDCSLSDGVRLMARERKVAAVDIGDAWWQDVDTPAMLHRAEETLPELLLREVSYQQPMIVE